MIRHEFENLALEHLDAVYRMAMQMVRHPDEAADLVQDTYLRALRASERFEETGGGIRPWLFKILRNVFYTRKSKAKREWVVAEELEGLTTKSPGPGEPAPAWSLATFDWEQVDERLKAAIEQLRPEYRTVLLLWAVEGMKYREIAEIEDIPIGTVMSRLHRARRILAQELIGFAPTTRSIPNVELVRSTEQATAQVWPAAA